MAEKLSESERPSNSVIIVNKLAQTLTVTTDSGNGVQSIRLAGNGASDPVLESSLTTHTRNLVAQGHLKLRNAS